PTTPRPQTPPRSLDQSPLLLFTLLLSRLFFSCFFFFHSSVHHRDLHSFPTRRSSDLCPRSGSLQSLHASGRALGLAIVVSVSGRSEEHTSELQSRENLVCRLLLEKKNIRD